MDSEVQKYYLNHLEELKTLSEGIPNTYMMALGKVLALINLNLRYEKIKEDRNLEIHPYISVKNLVDDTKKYLSIWQEQQVAEGDEKPLQFVKLPLEKEHQKLFQKLWIKFSDDQYDERIARYEHRLDINELGSGFLNGFRCIDFGCGHGNFSHALLRKGAGYVFGIDYGEENISYARDLQNKISVPSEKMSFELASVYDTKQESESYDLAIQNGVFHHLEDEDKAYREATRILKKGGWFWIYTTGEGAITNDLWAASTYILREIPHDFVISVLGTLNLKVGKRYYLGDGLNATYRRTSWNAITGRLKTIGYGNFKRLIGGYDTDFDHDVIAKDDYGVEKFGEGDLRFLAQKL